MTAHCPHCGESVALVSITTLVPALAAFTLFVGPAVAQSPGEAFCNTDMATTIQSIFSLIQFGGPLLGGVLALGATVILPFVRRSDWKKEMEGSAIRGCSGVSTSRRWAPRLSLSS